MGQKPDLVYFNLLENIYFSWAYLILYYWSVITWQFIPADADALCPAELTWESKQWTRAGCWSMLCLVWWCLVVVTLLGSFTSLRIAHDYKRSHTFLHVLGWYLCLFFIFKASIYVSSHPFVTVIQLSVWLWSQDGWVPSVKLSVPSPLIILRFIWE